MLKYIIFPIILLKLMMAFNVAVNIEDDEEEGPDLLNEDCKLIMGYTAIRGRSIFAGKEFKEGETVGVGIVNVIPEDMHSAISHYAYQANEEGFELLIYGAGMMYNHKSPNSDIQHEWVHDDIPQVSSQRADSNTVFDKGVRHYAKKLIPKGSEIFFDYGGHDWFTDRGMEDFEVHDKLTLDDIPFHQRICLSDVEVHRSEQNFGGQGLFTTQNIAAGSVVTVSAALAVPVETFEQHIHATVLVNYAISNGRPEHPYYLVPLSDIAMVNHGGNSQANVDLAFYDGHLGEIVPFPQFTFEELEEAESAGLDLALVARRDIGKNEELLLDYGVEWEHAWFQYLKNLDTDEHYEECYDEKEGVDIDNIPELCFRDLETLPQFRQPIVAPQLVDRPRHSSE